MVFLNWKNAECHFHRNIISIKKLFEQTIQVNSIENITVRDKVFTQWSLYIIKEIKSNLLNQTYSYNLHSFTERWTWLIFFSGSMNNQMNSVLKGDILFEWGSLMNQWVFKYK